MKKLLSFLFSLIIAVVPLLLCVPAASAVTYEEQLKKNGFPDSYIPKLAALHKKYPNWNFVPFKTGLDFNNAVNGERSSHKKQILETGYNSNYYCSCSNCKKNGKFVYVYSGCYSASDWAVRYFIDPRNHLDEKHIFQFESNKYNASHNQSGVESIISKTFMKNANISYTRTFGDTAYYTDAKGNKVKYSKVILDAAKAHNISAYFIASRIVKEVGSTKPANVSGTAGNKSPFTGIYNYYNIGATSGGMSGVEWASGYLLANKNTSLYPGYDKSAKKPTGDATAIKSGQRMSYIGTYDNYYKVKLYSDSSGYSTNGKVGFVPVSALRTTYFTYGRPWTSPAKSIDGGAHYIADKYLAYQYTSYLEKFNVNKASGALYNHEYMQNVDAPSHESVSRYNAYSGAGQLAAAKTFYIPVFNNMPADTSTNAAASTSSVKAVTGVKVKDTTTSSITLKWNKLSKATNYYVRVKDVASGKVYSKKVKTTSATVNKLSKGKVYDVWVKAYAGKWGAYSAKVTTRCVPKKAAVKKVTSPSKGAVKVQWNKLGGAAGYQVLIAKDKKCKNLAVDKLVKKNTAAASALPKGTYYVRVRAYINVGGTKYYGKYSAAKKVKVK